MDIRSYNNVDSYVTLKVNSTDEFQKAHSLHKFNLGKQQIKNNNRAFYIGAFTGVVVANNYQAIL